MLLLRSFLRVTWSTRTSKKLVYIGLSWKTSHKTCETSYSWCTSWSLNLTESEILKLSFYPLFDSQQLKTTQNWFFDNCFFEGSMSTPNDIGSWILTWTMVLSYIFKYCRRREASHPSEKYEKISGHVTLNEIPWETLFIYAN